MKHLITAGLISACLFAFTSRANAQNDYFQQQLAYDIDVLLDAEEAMLYANYQLQYTNQSPDTLEFIYMHLYPNAYGYSGSAMAQERTPVVGGGKKVYFADEQDAGMIRGLDFTSPQMELSSLMTEPDIMKITLSRPLKPSESITLQTAFEVKIPKAGYSRMGHQNGNFQITQWFPKPAVYDRDGWHPVPNQNVGEFYGEYGSFNVNLMVPEDFTTASTGIVTNTTAWKAQQLAGFKPDITESVRYKTISVKADNVHTFAWCSGKDYKRLSKSMKIEGIEQEIKAVIIYREDRDHWHGYFDVIEDAIQFYSDKVGPYPYPQVTVAQSVGTFGGGMEYPMFTLIDKVSGYAQETVIMHEIGHNWFYGVLGFNEREHPWMDEGLNTMYETMYMNHKYPDISLQDFTVGTEIKSNLMGLGDKEYKDLHYLSYKLLAGKHLHKPTTLHSNEFDATEYFMHTYYYAAQQLLYLRSVVGEQAWDEFMQSFYEKWKFKHPLPRDFFAHLKEHFPDYGPWFANNMITTTKTVDYKICKVKAEAEQSRVIIKNKGTLNAPFRLLTENKDGQKDTLLIEGFQGKKTITLKNGPVLRLQIDPEKDLPETRRSNNNYDNSKLFSKSEPLKVKWLYRVPTANKKYLFHTPVLGYNTSDKLMPGWLFYNDPAFATPFRFRIMPLLSTNSGELAGEGRLSYVHYSRLKNFTAWKLSTYAKRYNYSDVNNNPLYYLKISPELVFYFPGRKNTKVLREHRAGLRFHYIDKEIQVLSMVEMELVNQLSHYNIYEAFYEYESKKIAQEHSIEVNLQYAEENLKVGFEWNYFWKYHEKHKGLKARFFGGSFLIQETSFPIDMRFRLSSWTGEDDYTYSNTMLDRSFIGQSDLFSRQLLERDGGFKLPTAAGQSWEHMLALNLHADFPGKLPLGIFASLGNYGSKIKTNENIVYEAGISLSLYRDQFRVYLPLTYSETLDKASTGKSRWDNIRFSMNLDLLNPFGMLEIIDPTYK